jgi:UDP-N-acetyl-D-mannosaminuronic acid dehydrogenase
VLARKINDFMPAHMFELLNSALEGCNLEHPKIAILGWAFAPNTGDFRNTPTGLFRELCLKGGMNVSCHDPYVWDVKLDDVISQANAVVIFTAHNEYKDLDPIKLQSLMATPIIVDGRNVVDPEVFIEAGFVYRGIGRGDLK